MDNTLFSACQFVEHPIDWRHAIKLACQPLEAQEAVDEHYAQAIINATEQNGPWYILSPEFALPHARPEEGVLCQQSELSLLCTAQPVAFPGHPQVRLIIVLAAADSEKHILTIQRLVGWLDEELRLEALTAVTSQAQFAVLLQPLLAG